MENYLSTSFLSAPPNPKNKPPDINAFTASSNAPVCGNLVGATYPGVYPPVCGCTTGNAFAGVGVGLLAVLVVPDPEPETAFPMFTVNDCAPVDEQSIAFGADCVPTISFEV